MGIVVYVWRSLAFGIFLADLAEYWIVHIYSQTYFQEINETWYESSKWDLFKIVLVSAIWHDAELRDFLQEILMKLDNYGIKQTVGQTYKQRLWERTG